MKVLVTGAGGLIGSEAVEHYCRAGHHVCGIDNNMRQEFFGSGGDVSRNITRLETKYPDNFVNYEWDIRSKEVVDGAIRLIKPDVVIHCAAQPSHDKAASIPYIDFDVNAVGTLNLLESTRNYAHDAVFIFMSTNKVYGDTPNRLALTETETRYVCADERYSEGIDESMSIDQTMHSLFGASKVAADVMAQEYGRYFEMKVGVFRGGCLTGPNHAGVQLHGFLSYLVKCAVQGIPYTIIGYKGKQVRDQIHSHDVIRAFDMFIENPRHGEVYNLGGCAENSASVIELIDMLEQRLKTGFNRAYVDTPRKGDHQWYVSSMKKFKDHFPGWKIEKSLDEILDEMIYASRK